MWCERAWLRQDKRRAGLANRSGVVSVLAGEPPNKIEAGRVAAAGLPTLYQHRHEPGSTVATAPTTAALVARDLAAEQLEDELAVLVGDRQGLHAELLLGLQGAEARGRLVHVGIDKRTDT